MKKIGLVGEIVKESTRQEFNAIIKTMQQTHGIEAVILGCTE